MAGLACAELTAVVRSGRLDVLALGLPSVAPYCARDESDQNGRWDEEADRPEDADAVHRNDVGIGEGC